MNLFDGENINFDRYSMIKIKYHIKPFYQINTRKKVYNNFNLVERKTKRRNRFAETRAQAIEVK